MISTGARGFGYAQAAADRCGGAGDVQAPMLQGQSKGMARALARAEALAAGGTAHAIVESTAARQMAGSAGQTPVQGQAMSAGTDKELTGPDQPGSCLLQYYMDLASGVLAGPKPASALDAEARYLAARRVTG